MQDGASQPPPERVRCGGNRGHSGSESGPSPRRGPDQDDRAEWLSNFEIDLPTLTSLESALLVDYTGDDYDKPVAAWIEENREWVDSLTE